MGYERQQRKLGTPMANDCWAILVVTLTGITATTWAYEVSQGPTELIQYDPGSPYEGYTLFVPMLGRNAYLIDMRGQVVNMWPTPENWWEPEIRESARLLEDGTLLRAKTVGDGSTPGTYQLADGQSFEDFLEAIERSMITEALEESRWNKTAAA